MACLTESKLLRFLDNHLSDAEELDVAEHLDQCGGCRRLAENLSDDPELREYHDSGREGDGPADSSNPDSPNPDSSNPADSSDLTDKPRGERGERQLGRFQILDMLGVGGFGVVYLAFDTTLKRKIAIKLPKQAAFIDPDAKQRFMREAEIAASLHHPNIVPVFEAGEADGLCYLASAYCSGPSLATWHYENQGRVDSRVAACIVERLARAVAHAHESGVLHRDIKPANVLLELKKPSGELPFTPMLTDFGLAKLIDDQDAATVSGAVFGTPRYMAPEQAAGRRDQVGLHTDVYALGAVLYELLTDRPPIEGEDNADTLRRVLESEPPSPRSIRLDISVDIEAICLKCLEKEPCRRYENAAQLGEDLNRYLNDEPILARRVSSLERSWRWCRRRPAAAASILAGAATVLTAFVLVLVAMQLNVSRERGKRLEKEAELHQSQLTAAKELADSQRQVAATQQYYALVSGVRERGVNSELGWAFDGLLDLQQAAALDVEVVDQLDLRNQAARCITGVDLREITTIPVPTGYEPHMLAFHPDGTQLAIATLGSIIEVRVLVCGVPSGEIVNDLRIPVTSLQFDGVRQIAYLGDGDELAITTRSGWLYRWQLSDSPPSRRSTRLPHRNSPFVFDGPRHRAFFSTGDNVYAWPDLSVSVAEEFSSGKATRLRVSPDGRWLAVGRSGVEILDTRTRQLVRHFKDLSTEVGFRPDSRVMASIWTNELVLTDVKRGTTIRKIRDPDIDQLHEDAVTEVSFSPDGGLLMTSGHDQKFKLWDANSGTLLSTVMIVGADEVRAAFSPDARYIAATGRDHVVLYSLNGPDVLGTAAAQTDPIGAFDVSSDPAVIFCSAAHRDTDVFSLSLWDFKRGAIIDCWQCPGAYAGNADVAISDDGRILAASNNVWRNISTWRIDVGHALDEPTRKDSPLDATSTWSPTSQLLFQGDTFTRIVGTSTVAEPLPISSLGLPWSQVDAAVNSGNGRAYFFRRDEFCEFDIRTNRVVDGYPRKIADHWPELWEQDIDAAVNWGHDEAHFFRGDQRIVLRLPSRQQVKRGEAPNFFRNIDAALASNDDKGIVRLFTRDACRHYVGKRSPVTEHRISDDFPGFPVGGSIQAAVDLRLRTSLDHRLGALSDEVRAKSATALVMSRNADMLFGVDGLEVVAWSLPEVSERWRWSNAQVAMLAGIGTISSLDAGKRLLAVGVKSKSIHLFDIDSGERIVNIPAPGRVSSVALSDDETLVAGGTEDGTVVVATVSDGKSDGKIVARLDKHRDEITSLAFSARGQLLATASRDRTIRLWRREGGAFQQVLKLESSGSVQLLRFAPGSDQLIALIKGESVLRVWRLDRLRERLADVQLNW